MQDEITAAIATDLGIAELPVSEQQELIAQFGEVALKAATLAVCEKLTKEKQEEFAKLSEIGDFVTVKTFLDREVPAHEEIAKMAVAEEVRRFKDFQANGTHKGSTA